MSFPLSLFLFDEYTGKLTTTYSVLSNNGSRPVFHIGEYGWNALWFNVTVDGIDVKYIVRKTIMQGDWVKCWFMTPTKFSKENLPDCEGTVIFVNNDMMLDWRDR